MLNRVGQYSAFKLKSNTKNKVLAHFWNYDK